MNAHLIYITNKGNRSYLGMNTETGKAVWVSEWIVTKPMSDLYLLVYKTRESAEATATKIGRGASVLTINVNL